MEKTKGFEQTKNWRSVAVAKNNKPLNAKKTLHHKEDIVRRAQGLEALAAAIRAIEAGNLTKEQLANNIRYIVTIVGDLHCPTHYIYPEALAQRKMHYFYNGKKHNYVSYWEHNSVAGTFNWKSNEFVHQLNRKSPEQIAAITKGSITNWVTKNAAEYRNIYTLLESGKTFDQKSLRLWQNNIYPISTEQVAIAGYRIAAILNGLFDSNVPNVKIK